MKRLLVVAASAAMLVSAGASGAFAGEVKGPPNQQDNENTTGALDHANSACAASGLNDFDSEEGQNVSQVQPREPTSPQVIQCRRKRCEAFARNQNQRRYGRTYDEVPTLGASKDLVASRASVLISSRNTSL